MSRYLLDTNIITFMLLSEPDKLSYETTEIIDDYNSQLYTSSISVMELMQLYRIGKIKTKKYKTATALYDAIESEFYIKILPFAKQHTATLSKLKIADGHNDPFDHSIISQAITEKLILVSSDRQFENYTKQNLNFSFNKR
jgi:tRNA(fMet)-specific endonuclease VapC